MRLDDALGIAARNLWAHRLRTALTMLGMTFGVGAVIAMLSIGAGAERESLRLIERLGLRNVVVRAKDVPESERMEVRKKSLGLSERDVMAILEALPQVEAAAPRIVVPAPGVRGGRSQADGTAVGVPPTYATFVPQRIREGRALDAKDEADAAQHCVIGAGLRSDLFPGEAAVGQNIRVLDLWCRVVGVFEPDAAGAASFEGVALGSSSREVVMPLATARARLAKDALADPFDEIVVAVRQGEDVAATGAALRPLLDRLHGGAEDWSLVVPETLLRQSQRTQRLFNAVMGAIAGISLLVGGIGIMNIMLASVMEQWREIGVRRAVGATRGDIRLQFLLSSFVLSALGGVAGVVLGVGIAEVVSVAAGWPTVVRPGSILLSTSVSAAVGLVSGLYPAHRAASLDPMEALRYE